MLTTSSEAELAPHQTPLHDHIIVCGLRNLGFRIVEQIIQANIAIVVIDNQPEERFAEILEDWNVPLVRRDSRSAGVLRQAGIMTARAIVTVSDEDLKNLETILEAENLRPGIRKVASFGTSEVAEKLVDAMPNAEALSLPVLTSTTFVTAALLPNQILHLFEIEKEEMAVVRDRPSRADTLRGLYGLFSPIQIEKSVTDPDGAPGLELDTSPLPDTRLQTSDMVYLVGRVQDLIIADEVRLDQRELNQRRDSVFQKAPPKKRANRFLRWQRSVRRVFRDVLRDRPFRWALILFGLLVVTAFLVLLLDRQDEIADALYFGLNMVTGQTIFSAKTKPELMIFGFAVGFLGIVLLSIVNAYITNYIISKRIGQVLGQQRATFMSNHVVLSGLGGVGYQVLRGLVARGEEVVVIEQDENGPYNNLARNLGVPVIHADARMPESLDMANIAKARCVIVTTNDDLVNLETAVNARDKNPGLKVVLRLFDRSLAEKIENRFNIHTARSSSALAAPYFVASALNYEVITTFYGRQTTFIVTRLKVKAGSELEGHSVGWVYQQTGINVLAYIEQPKESPLQPVGPLIQAERIMVGIKEDVKFYPDPQKVILSKGDAIYCVGPYDRITALYKLNG